MEDFENFAATTFKLFLLILAIGMIYYFILSPLFGLPL